MKNKKAILLLILFNLLFSIACDDELKDCYDTVCDGPDNTNCREEPNFNSGCFPPPDTIIPEVD